MSARVLVTGGAGFIGSHLVDALLAAGERVTVLDDFSTGSMDNLEAATAADLNILEGSILDEASVMAAMRDCNQVFHLAVTCVRSSIGDPVGSHAVNATGTLNVLETARRLGIERFVYCSSSEVYGNASDGLLNEMSTVCRPATVYGGAKLAGEHYTSAYQETYGLPTTIVRPFNAYGPRAPDRGVRAEVIPRFMIRVLSGLPPIVFGDGSNGRDFTYVTDIVRGILAASRSQDVLGKRVNIACGRMLAISEIASGILEALGRNDLSVQFADPRPGDVRWLHADTALARRLLGFQPAIGFQEGLSRYIDWFQTHRPDPSALLEEQPENWSLPPVSREA